MNQDTTLISCPSCSARNRVPKRRLKDHPLCGKCGERLRPETLILPCTECGAKNRIFRAMLDDHPRCGRCHAALDTIPRYSHPVPITDSTFQQEVLGFPAPVLMEYYSPMCAYCKTLDPILHQLASEYAGRVKIGKMNIDQSPLTASRYEIMSTPTLIFFKDGKPIDKLLGTVSKDEIENHLRRILT